MAREFVEKALHVVHVVVDADVQMQTKAILAHADPMDLAETVYWLHRQPRSTWTQELDVRPYNEAFWERCLKQAK